MKVVYFGTMKGYQRTAHGPVALVPGDNELEASIAEELLDRGIVRPPLEETMQEAIETGDEPGRGVRRRRRATKESPLEE